MSWEYIVSLSVVWIHESFVLSWVLYIYFLFRGSGALYCGILLARALIIKQLPCGDVYKLIHEIIYYRRKVHQLWLFYIINVHVGCHLYYVVCVLQEVKCLQLLKKFSPKHFEPKLSRQGYDELDVEQTTKLGKRGQITDQLVELPIDHQIYDMIDAEGSKGLTFTEVRPFLYWKALKLILVRWCGFVFAFCISHPFEQVLSSRKFWSAVDLVVVFCWILSSDLHLISSNTNVLIDLVLFEVIYWH